MEYQIKSEQFTGPIHILLGLIEDRKMHVSEVSLSAVTEDFLRFMNEASLPYSEVTSFIVIASTLVLIKARSLLPNMPLTEEEQESISDLTERVRQYQIVQKFSEKLSSQYLEHVSFERKWVDRNPVFAPDPQITQVSLKSLLEQLFVAFPIIEKLPEKVVKTVVKIEDMIANLTKRIQEGIAFHSRDMMDKYRNATDPAERRHAKVFAVVSFLAILELVKKGIANVLQNENFADIELNKQVQETELTSV